MTELMEEYEARTGLGSTREVGTYWCNEEAHTESYVDDLEERLIEAEAKAAAYDRLMSGGLKTIIKTIKEFISTIPDSDVWWCPNCGETECSFNGRCVNCGLYIDTPDIEAEKIKNTFTLLLDSLTLPGGWEVM